MPRRLSYEDEDGRLRATLIPDDAPDSMARAGILLGPQVDLASLGLPLELEVRLHNELFNRGIFTVREARRRRLEIQAALQAALRVDVDLVLAAYAQDPPA